MQEIIDVRLYNVRQNNHLPQLLTQLGTPYAIAEQEAEVVTKVLNPVTPDPDLEDMQSLVVGDAEVPQDVVRGAAEGNAEWIDGGTFDGRRGEDEPEYLDDVWAAGERIVR